MTSSVQSMAAVRCSSQSSRRITRATGYDCVRVVVVRDGSVLLADDSKLRTAACGDAVLIAPGAVLGYEPEGQVCMTTLLIDTDYLIDHLFWQHLDLIPDRDAARELAARLYPEPVQVLRLGEREVERLGPILDELATRTKAAQDAAGYFRAHALLMMVLEAITPHIRHAAVEVPPLTARQRAVRSAPPRWRAFRPVRREAARVAALMHSDIARHWPLDALAAHACLSPSQLSRVFKEAFGITPLAYLSMLRVQEMARLIRETDLLVTVIAERVGWCYHSGVASRAFRRYMGVTPIHYRRYGPPTESREGPGVAVARAACDAHREV